MDRINYIALAIPFFFVFIGIELWVAARRRQRVYRFTDAVTDLGCGVGQQVSTLFLTASLFLPYVYLYENFSIYTFDAKSVLPWVIAFLGVDFAYHWWHRLSHEINFLWAAHIVHHQSEDYNFAVALRQGINTRLTGFVFYLPLAVIGIPPLVYATMQSFSVLYQFWIHTQLIGKLGFLEFFLNTPSHHRVHHAINPQYLDKNYGATLIIWDRLFGTFEEEKEAPVYGLVKPLNSYNSLWAQFHYIIDLAKDSWKAKGIVDKIKVWLISPAEQVKSLPPKPEPTKVSPETFVKYEPPTTPEVKRYAAAHFLFVLIGTFFLLLWQGFLSFHWLLAFAALIYLTLATISGLFEAKRWARPLELCRLFLLAAGAISWFWGSTLLPYIAAATLAVTALWIAWLFRLSPSLSTALRSSVS